ncbi:PREDICTED: probable LRR receptor-like serine/threonine-protein kinase At3g47570 [Ipomoea nil]|uniref:probable LRR receptor-like serine/threonine-protein kinase At3g47570 n=1 Tax=Ipomoea nil TaxID=35883 RepID=UPI0009016295|nr:PREDICTED: probable LRR receptor-like serine/threonine-protein kinase At3g47570 [Ipomoea nil]
MASPPATTTEIIQLTAPSHFPIKLTPSNFSVWRRQVQSTLIGFNLLGFIDGSVKEPAAFNDSARTVANPAHLVCYACATRGRIISLKAKLTKNPRGVRSVTAYLNDMRSIADELALAQCPVSDEDLVVYVLTQLGEEYNSIMSAVRICEIPISLGELADILTDHERQLKDADDARQSLMASANITQHGSFGSRNQQSASNRRSRNVSDHQALLSFKANMNGDPLQSWNESTHFCNWVGITCGRKHQRVVTIHLESSNLQGSLSPAIGNLSFLRELRLYNNTLSGIIPNEMGRLRRLSVLDLESNVFSGEIPKNLSHCKPLDGRDTSLHRQFFITQGDNYLSSTIPISMFNLSSLVTFDVQGNKLEGYLPSNLGSTLPNLHYFNIGYNLLRGRLPISMSNATALHHFDVRHNDFYGGVPSFSGLKRLKYFVLYDNPLGNGKSTDMDFMSSLLNSTATLETLYLDNCNFGGVLPTFIANFSHLQSFSIAENVVSGTIPSGICLLVNLQYLDLSENQLGGTIPSSWGSLQQLIGLRLEGNKLFGEIPISLGNLSILSELYLQSNELQGTIPISFENFKYLLALDLSRNKLQGNFPKVNLTSLVHLDVSHNHFTGPLPVEIGGFKNLLSLNLSNNIFLGTLPSTIGALSSLIELNISHNLFHGFILPSFSSLKSLEILDLSCNNLTGKIPEFLGELQYLKWLNLSFNHLEGKIPTEGIFKHKAKVELVGNNLCGGIPQFGLPICPREGERQHLSHIQKLAILFSSGTLILLIIVALIVFTYKQKKKQALTLDAATEFMPKLSYWSIQKATNEFSKSSIIGFGKFSTVYKGILDGSLGIVAIKVFKLQVRGASKSFSVECEALRQIRHRNLVKVLTTCCSIDHEGNDFLAIVYEYMINGTLDNWLHNHSKDTGENNDSKSLNLLQRINTAIDVANALDYLHNQLETGLIHCDLKPSNILLDGDLVAHVADFGLSKFLPTEVTSNQASSSIGIKGTFGYAAPEYGMGSDLSTFGDMYSYGILLLEIFTSKSPTSDIFNNGLTLHNYVRLSMLEQVTEIVDPTLFHNEANATPKSLVLQNQIIECLVSILKIGIACSLEYRFMHISIQIFISLFLNKCIR